MSVGKHDLIYNDPDWGHEIARLAGTYYNARNSANIARVVSGECHAGVVFTNYVRGVSIFGHTAIFVENGMSRDLLFAGLDYPFNQLRVKRIFGLVPECNERAKRFNMRLGFKEVARIEGVFLHDDACIVMRLDREDCKLLDTVKPRNVQSYRNVFFN